MRRKYGDKYIKEKDPSSQNYSNLPKNFIKHTKGSAGFGGADGGVDTNHVIKLIEEKKNNLPNLLLPVDIEIVITHDEE